MNVTETKKIIIIELLQVLPIIILAFFTLSGLENATSIPYLVFLTSFAASVSFSLFLVVKYQKGFFYYLLSLLLFLGFPFKFSIHEILNTKYIEPTGLFDFSLNSYSEVLSIATIGALGLLFAQLFSYFAFIKKNPVTLKENNQDHLSRKKSKFLFWGISFVIIAMSIINLKYNILICGLTPSLILPFKGNAIYFLLLTRIIPLALFFYCFDKNSKLHMILGAFLFMIISIAITSRMVIVLYFILITLSLLKQYLELTLKDFFTKLGFIVILFAAFSYITVQVSSKLRYVFHLEDQAVQVSQSENASEGVTEKRDLKDTVKSVFDTGDISKYANYGSLAVERWVGMEGLMTVVAHPYRGYDFFLSALQEKSFKNDGRSFYNTITDLKLMEILKSNNQAKNISTSVPGPVAFFYYSNSKLVVFLGLFIMGILIFVLENFCSQFFTTKIYFASYISVFMAFDFYQFGISPSSFSKYWIFSFGVIISWLYFEKYRSKLLK